MRRAESEEAPAIATILAQAFAEYEPLYAPEGLAATTPDSEHIRQRFREGPVWVAAQGQTIVGTVSAVPKGEGLYIRSMAVLPSARGQRLGEHLLGEVEQFARVNGFARLFLSTTPFLARAIRLYERSGFVRSEEGPHDLCGTPLLTMVKQLT